MKAVAAQSAVRSFPVASRQPPAAPGKCPVPTGFNASDSKKTGKGATEPVVSR